MQGDGGTTGFKLQLVISYLSGHGSLIGRFYTMRPTHQFLRNGRKVIPKSIKGVLNWCKGTMEKSSTTLPEHGKSEENKFLARRSQTRGN